MKPFPSSPPARRPAWFTSATAFLAIAAMAAGAATLQSDHDVYYPGEEIRIAFSGGPGAARDWIGVYLPEQTPGPVPSTIWRYVDNTQNGNTGFQSGAVTFPAGLALAGDWLAYFFVNDGYDWIATNQFKVVDPGTPLVRVGSRVYLTGQPITITFTNGPANPKDWVGIYKEGQVPGGPQSTLWAYVDGTQNGNTVHADGTITFNPGLAEPGPYVVHFLLNDGNDILATESFRVEPAGSSSSPRVLAVSPTDGASNQPPVLRFTASITNGTLKVVTSSIQLTLDGTPVTPQVTTPAEGLTSITYQSPALPAVGSTHHWVLTFADDAARPETQRIERTTTVGSYRNVVLPSPLYFENFDSIAEGELPAGWTQKSYTTPLSEGMDFQDLSSPALGAWVAIGADRFRQPFKTYGVPDSSESDYARVLSVNLFNVLNGKVLEGPLAQGRFLFANSGYQNSGSGQVLYLFTRDFDLTGRTNVHLAFKSLWEQNQDSLAAVEYSIDRGATWLPVAYFLDSRDILKVEGTDTIDVTATFTTEQSDIARYVDDTGAEVGGTYGAFIAAPLSEALAPAIQGRVDDNPVESKRVEFFALPKADQQATVRFRFAHAGADSWYFGIDDFGLYALGAASGPAPALTIEREGLGLRLTWPSDATGYGLETSTTALPGSWSAVSGVVGSSHPVTPSGGAGFYRLARP